MAMNKNESTPEKSVKYVTVARRAETEFEEKRSIFICNVAPVKTEDEAMEFIKSIKKKYADATHNVWAYLLCGEIVARYSDDGEPQGTAGMPILHVLDTNGVADVVCTVTRYFGGILLGAGGLVRAYAKGAKIGIDKAGISEFCQHVTFDFEVSYSDYEKVLRDLDKNGVLCSGTDFGENVLFHLSCVEANYEKFVTYAADLTGGKRAPIITGTTSRLCLCRNGIGIQNKACIRSEAIHFPFAFYTEGIRVGT